MTDDELYAQAMADLETLHKTGAVLPLELAPAEACQLLSILQLALRHPGVTAAAHTSAFARTLAENIGRRLSRTPALTELVRRGFDAAYDEPAPAERASPPNTSESGGPTRRPAQARATKGRRA